MDHLQYMKPIFNNITFASRARLLSTPPTSSPPSLLPSFLPPIECVMLAVQCQTDRKAPPTPPPIKESISTFDRRADATALFSPLLSSRCHKRNRLWHRRTDGRTDGRRRDRLVGIGHGQQDLRFCREEGRGTLGVSQGQDEGAGTGRHEQAGISWAQSAFGVSGRDCPLSSLRLSPLEMKNMSVPVQDR